MDSNTDLEKLTAEYYASFPKKKDQLEEAFRLILQNDWDKKDLFHFIKLLFFAVDSGDVRMDIPAYNGGLFAKDEKLDSLKISDSILEKVVNLSSYDFRSDVDVNILGHIFEQSLDDLEKIRENIEKNSEIQKQIRKKDGIFYTPQYITKYIIENSVGN